MWVERVPKHPWVLERQERGTSGPSFSKIMTRPRLLFCCQTLPFPPDGGVAIRSFNTLRLLSQRYDVTALFFYRRGVVRSVEASTLGLEAFGKVQAFPIAQEFSRARFIWDHLRSVVSRKVYTRFVHESETFRRALRDELQRQEFDVVHFDSLDLATYIPEVNDIPTVVVHHNVESALLRRRATLAKQGLVKKYLTLQSRLMQREEVEWCPKAQLNVVVSPDDERQLTNIAPGIRTLLVPNGVDIDYFTPVGTSDRGIVFVGGTTWFPNKDALEYFAGEILPKLGDPKLLGGVHWVGRAKPEEVELGARDGIALTGYVDDVRPYVNRAACYVVPIRVGGGTRLKILDAWAMGKAVVSTTVGCEGLDATDGWNIIIRDDPAEFAAAVKEILNDEELRRRLGANARATAERNYSWNVIGERMIRAYSDLHV